MLRHCGAIERSKGKSWSMLAGAKLRLMEHL